jgi:hypothetical protein
MTEEVRTILDRCRELGVRLAPGVDGKLRVSPPPDQLPKAIREALRRHKAEVLSALAQREGLLVKSQVLELSVWLVRTEEEGRVLAQETGHPAVCLDDVLRKKGRTTQEARAALLPLLISPAAEQ